MTSSDLIISAILSMSMAKV